jgi:hypothetical protein
MYNLVSNMNIRYCLFFIFLFLLFDSSYGQSQVSEQKKDDPVEHPLLLNLQNVLNFNVQALDGKMSRINAVSDYGSAWIYGEIGTNTAIFTGVPNKGKAGTFRPIFSGEVTKTGEGNGTAKKYDWTAKAKYELSLAKFTIYVDQPVPGKREIYAWNYTEFVFGHSFWQIETKPYAVNNLPEELKPSANGVFGYYPTKIDTLNPFSGQIEERGIIRNDKNHTWNVKKEYNILQEDNLITLLNLGVFT